MYKYVSLAIIICLFPITVFAQDNACKYEDNWVASVVTMGQNSLPIEGVATVGAVGTDIALLDMDVTCSGSLTGTISGEVEIQIIPGITDPYILCTSEYSGTINGTVTENAQGLPNFTVKVESLTGSCNGESLSAGSTARLISDEVDEGRYLGSYEKTPGSGMGSVEEIIQLFEGMGGDFTFILNHFDAYRSVSPKLVNSQAQYIRYFLQTVPVTNTYTAEIDWDKADYRRATISINGDEPEEMTLTETGASYDLEVGDMSPTGDVDIEIVLDVEGYGIYDNTPDSLITIVPYPVWAQGLKFEKPADGNNILYRAQVKIPEEPIETLIIEIPSFVPFIGGNWGLSPVQITADIVGTSAGGVHSEPVSAIGTLFLGDQQTSLKVDGSVYTNMSKDGLAIMEDASVIIIGLTEPLKFEANEPLIALIPGVSALYQIPELGDLLQTLSSFASIRANLEADIPYGQAKIGVTPQNKVGIVSGDVDLRTAGSIGMLFNVGVAWAQISGTLVADAGFALAPEVAPKTCSLSVLFTLQAAAFGSLMEPQTVGWTIPLCTP